MYKKSKLNLTVPLNRETYTLDENNLRYRTKSLELILDLIDKDHARKDIPNSTYSQILTSQYLISKLDRTQSSINYLQGATNAKQ